MMLPVQFGWLVYGCDLLTDITKGADWAYLLIVMICPL